MPNIHEYLSSSEPPDGYPARKLQFLPVNLGGEPLGCCASIEPPTHGFSIPGDQ